MNVVLGKESGRFFKENHHQNECTSLEHLFKSAFKQDLFLIRALFIIYSSAARVERSRHKHREDVGPSTGLEEKNMSSRGLGVQGGLCTRVPPVCEGGHIRMHKHYPCWMGWC